MTAIDHSAIKQALYAHCQLFVATRLGRLQETLANIQESLSNETKSSAGDKHETGRAMIQLEREKAGAQLAEIQKLQQILAKVKIDTPATVVRMGSLVYTSQANYFIAISAGEIQLEQGSFYAIAPNTPIGQLLLGKSAGEKVNFNSQPIQIKNCV